jgi:hypothetical protein
MHPRRALSMMATSRFEERLMVPQADTTIRPHRDALPIHVPDGYTGPLTLPGNGRTIYWTGRVAIGLRHQAPQHAATPGQSAIWIQDLLLAA